MELDLFQKIFIILKSNAFNLWKDNYLIILSAVIYGAITGFIIDKFIPHIIFKVLFLVVSVSVFVFSYLYYNLYPCSLSYVFVPNKFLNMRNSFIKTIDENNKNPKILVFKSIEQEKDLCSVTCAEMVLNYYGDFGYNQKQIKCLAENKEYNKENFNLYFSTNFFKIKRGLSRIGYNWEVQNVCNKTIDIIEKEIDSHRPVIISTPYNVKYSITSYPIIDLGLHAMVVYGYDNDNIYIKDPILNKDQFLKINKKYFTKMICKNILLTRPKI